MIELLCGFDGSCPHYASGIKKEGKSDYRVYPGYRRLEGISEEAPGMGSRFCVRLRNSSDISAEARVLADWEKPKRLQGHDIGYIRHEKDNEWTMIPGFRAEETAIEYRLKLPGGITHLGLYPEYNYGMCEDFVSGMESAGVESRIIGVSRKERNIRMLIFPSPDGKAENFFVQARDHAYETAGSYCVEGIAEFLRSESALARYIRGKFNFYIVPMTNPDGVYEGMSRLTWERGADMNRVSTVEDPAHSALKKAIDGVKPSVHMNIHNWTDKFADGLLCNEAGTGEKIRNHFPDDAKHFKRWRVQTTEDFLRDIKADGVPEENKSWKNYCREQFNGTGVCFEFPWFGLNTSDMREKGRKALVAFALAVVEENRL